MKNLLLVSCAALGIACGGGSARATDIGLAPGSYDWAGGYVGVNIGAALNTSSVQTNYEYGGAATITDQQLDLIDALDFKDTADDAWFSGGLLAGYNWQFGNFVIGGEADLNYLGFDDSVVSDVSDVMSDVLKPGNTTATDTIEYTADWFGTFRARLGYAIDNLLIYGTGGLAYGKMDIQQQFKASNDAGETADWESSVSHWNAGWTLGGGMEYAYDRWVLGAEYLYVDLGTYDWGDAGSVKLATDNPLKDVWSEVTQSGKADFTFSVARATVKYRF